MLICLLVKLKRKMISFAYDCCHLPLVYWQIHGGKLYCIKFYRAVEFKKKIENIYINISETNYSICHICYPDLLFQNFSFLNYFINAFNPPLCHIRFRRSLCIQTWFWAFYIVIIKTYLSSTWRSIFQLEISSLYLRFIFLTWIELQVKFQVEYFWK